MSVFHIVIGAPISSPLGQSQEGAFSEPWVARIAGSPSSLSIYWGSGCTLLLSPTGKVYSRLPAGGYIKLAIKNPSDVLSHWSVLFCLIDIRGPCSRHRYHGPRSLSMRHRKHSESSLAPGIRGRGSVEVTKLTLHHSRLHTRVGMNSASC